MKVFTTVLNNKFLKFWQNAIMMIMVVLIIISRSNNKGLLSILLGMLLIMSKEQDRNSFKIYIPLYGLFQ